MGVESCTVKDPRRPPSRRQILGQIAAHSIHSSSYVLDIYLLVYLFINSTVSSIRLLATFSLSLP